MVMSARSGRSSRMEHKKSKEELEEERANRRCMVGFTCGLAIFFIVVMIGLAIYICASDQQPSRENKDPYKNSKEE